MTRRVFGSACALAGILVAAPAYGEESLAHDTSPALAAGNTAFAFELYGQLRAADGNLFISPFSISTALAMVYAGARGSTADEMARVLHFAGPADAVHAGYETLLDGLRPSGESGMKLEVANALWADAEYDFLPEYTQLVEKRYAARAAELEFRTRTEPSRQTINAWVAKHTNGKIEELLKSGVVSGDTLLVLTNAVYFKARWQTPFQVDATEQAPFHAAQGDVPAHLMRTGGKYPYAEHGGCQVLELPYAGESTSMLVVLPKSAGALEAVEKDLDAAWLEAVLAKREIRQVHLALPRFTDRYACQLGQALSALGMTAPFTSQADFSGMDGTRRLFVSAVVHEAFVEVNEEGTEAAGATGAVIAGTSMPAEPPVEFRADHPFIYLIRHNPTGTILFLGRLAEPK